MIHRGSALAIRVRKNLIGKERIFIDLGGNSYSSVADTPRSRASLAKFLREAAEMLEPRCSGECGREMDQEGRQIHFGTCPLAPRA